MTHSDTVLGLRGLLVLAAMTALGCGSSEDDTRRDAGDPGGHQDGEPDGSGDGQQGTPDACAPGCDSDAEPVDACQRQAAAERSFAEAHDDCASDADCVVIGSCDDAEYLAVSSSARSEAEALIAQRTCHTQDGQGQHAVCRDQKCQLAFATVACGEPGPPACAEGLAWQAPGCAAEAFPAGCYAACDPQAADGCAAGFTCQETVVHPCLEEPCDACATSTHLCRPAPACELLLSATLDGRTRAVLAQDAAAELLLTLENRSAAPLTFTYDAPCHGPDVTGLPGYDLWDACLQGACDESTSPTTLTLAAGERRTLARSLIAPTPSTCNADGLAVGSYALSFSLPNLTGATACGPTAAELRIEAGTSSHF